MASEDFSYPNETLDGKGGGTGFAVGSTWVISNTINVSSEVAVAGNFNNTYAFRNLATTIADTGTLWVSFDWGHTSSPGTSPYGGLSFFNGASSEILIIGNTFDTTTWGINGSGFSALQTTEGSIGPMKTGVAKITMGAGATDQIELWIGATGSPVNVSGAALVSASGFDLGGVDRLRILGQRAQSMDNLVIGTSMADVDAIPEPSAILLGAFGSLLLLRRRRC